MQLNRSESTSWPSVVHTGQEPGASLQNQAHYENFDLTFLMVKVSVRRACRGRMPGGIFERLLGGLRLTHSTHGLQEREELVVGKI